MKKIYKSFDELRELAEDLVREQGESNTSCPKGMIELIEELRIHQAELAIQNQELKRGQEEISRLHHEYEDLYESAPCGYLVVGSKGNITQCNLTGTSILGAQRSRLLNRTFSGFLARESRNDYFSALKEAEKTGSAKALQLKLSLDDGSFLWVRADIQADPGQDGLTKHWRLTLVEISEQKSAEQDLRASLEDKTVLLREVHHRVKNNLAVIAALLEIQLQGVKDPVATAVLKDLETRVRSIALVHELLYQNGNLARINFQEYLDSLLQDLRYSLAPGRNILCIARAPGISLGIDLAVPCGMIINELVTNSLKYAFPDGKSFNGKNIPEIKVEIQKDNGHYRILVTDNGIGFPKGVDLNNSPSFGLSLVRMIGTHQLGGKFELDRSAGTSITFTFKPQNNENA